MTLMMPIKPEPAQRIYSGIKKFELRKSIPPETGNVYLYETKDNTGDIHAIRGCFYFENYFKLPINELWDKVGVLATTQERFFKYYGTGIKYGIALSIERVELLKNPVTIDQIKKIDQNFSFPHYPWSYLQIDENSLVIKYLNNLPRKSFINNSLNSKMISRAESSLFIKPITNIKEEKIFRYLYETDIVPYYDGCEGYFNRLLDVNKHGFDNFGYFTQKKDIWTFHQDKKIIGFTVSTLKRGGSLKFGPTVLLPDKRGLGLGTKLKLLVELKYPNIRKFYCTVPETNYAGIKSNIRAGYRIEAHLLNQYGNGKNELVFGKLIKPNIPKLFQPFVNINTNSIRILNGNELDYKNLQEIVHLLLSPWYDDINNEFINGLINGMKQNLDISRKCKKVGIALQNEIPIGIIIVTHKRGGATKCSPFILNQNNLVCFQKLLEYASKSFIEFLSRKSYIHIPILQSFTIQNAINLGYKPEGILQEPYKPGIDVLVIGKEIT